MAGLPIAAAALAAQGRPVVKYRTLTRGGLAKPNVQLFSVSGAIQGFSASELGHSDKNGIALIDQNYLYGKLIGVASDGSVAITDSKTQMEFGKTGFLTLQVTDSHEKPLSGEQVTLLPAYDRSPLRPYGQRAKLREVDAAYSKVLSRATDVAGFARFSKLPVGQRFTVVAETKTGEMEFEGSIEVGMRRNVVVSDDREIVGHVYDGRSMKPIAGARVWIAMPPFSDAPVEDVQWETHTDSNGAYRFSGLPNYELGVRAGTESAGMANASIDSGPFVLRGYSCEYPYGGSAVYEWENGTFDLPAKPQTKIDFRMDPAVLVDVTLRNPYDAPLAGCNVAIRPVRTDSPSDHVSVVAENLRFQFLAGYGRYEVVFQKGNLGNEKAIGSLNITDAKPVSLTLDVPKE